MNETWHGLYPDDAEIDAFYAGRSAHAGSILGCRSVSGAVEGNAGGGAGGAGRDLEGNAGNSWSGSAKGNAGGGAGGAGGAVCNTEGRGVWRFCLWAPNARSVSVVGDFNNWDATCHPMERYRGLWVCFSGEAQQGDNYKYRVEGADGVIVMKADPYAVHAETPPGTASKVWDTGGYQWGDDHWLKKRAATDIFNAPLSIYEMHPGSWRKKEGYDYPSIRELAEELSTYVKQMGFTHVELMPINEFPFDGSWGYQVTGFFAVTSRFGTPQDFMYFVDFLHREGIGVIVDWVGAHFPKDTHGLPHFDGTWLYEHENKLRREHPEWGTYEFNYHRPEVVSFLVSSAVNLIELYHIDGIRVDAVSSMLYLDYGRPRGSIKSKQGDNIDYGAVEFLKALNTAVLADHPGTITVAEESTAFPLITKPPYVGGLGFSFKWNMGFMHDTLDYMRSDPYFRHGAHDKMTFSMYYAFSENFILPYSHDEVVHGKASMINKMFGDYEDKFAALKTLFGWQFGHPGKKLMFMGSEFAQFIEWDYQKELDWLLLAYESHKKMQEWVAALNRLYRRHGALHADSRGWDGFQWLAVEDRTNSVFAFMRSDGASQMVCLYNFSTKDFARYDIALPHPGRLRLVLSSSETTVKKTAKARAKELNGLPNSATLVLPKLSALFYDYTIEA